MRNAFAILALSLTGCVPSPVNGAPRADFIVTSGTQGRLAQSDEGARRRAPWIEFATDRETFVAHWNQYVPAEPDETVARIDFTKEIAVFLLLGPQQSGGYAIEPIDVKIEGAVIRVRARLVQPGSDDFTAQVITAPYAVVKTPAMRFDRIEWIDADGRLLATRVPE